RLEFGTLEGVPSAMRTQRTGTKRLTLLGLLHALAKTAVVVIFDEPRIGWRLRGHAALNSAGGRSSALTRSPRERELTSACRSMPRWYGCTLRMAGTVGIP